MAGLAGRRSGVEAVVKLRRGEAKERRDEQDRRPRTPAAAATVKRFVGLDWTGAGPGANEGLANLEFASLEWRQGRDVSSAASRGDETIGLSRASITTFGEMRSWG
jgi:hypothetical protein